MSVRVLYNLMTSNPLAHLANDSGAPVCGASIVLAQWEPATIALVVDDALCDECAYLRRQGLTAPEDPVFTTSVYLVNMLNTDFYKIGISIDPRRRLMDLQRPNPVRIRLVWHSQKCSSEGAHYIEREMHKRYDKRRISHQREWFRLRLADIADIKAVIKDAVDRDRAEELID